MTLGWTYTSEVWKNGAMMMMKTSNINDDGDEA
jgi:hypothetical protein